MKFPYKKIADIGYWEEFLNRELNIQEKFLLFETKIENNIDPFNILALTFTNKAAKEMTERISSISGGHEAKNITMGTFHSVFSKILRFNADRIGFPSNFTIYDTQDSKSLIKDIIKGFNLDDKTYKPSQVFGRISTAKNNLISPEDYNDNAEIKLEDKQSR